MNLGIFTFLISVLAVHSHSVYEVECEDGGEVDSWRSLDDFYTVCQLYHVHIANNFTKIKIYNTDEQNFTAVFTECCKFHVFPTEIFEQLPKIQNIDFHEVGMKEIRDFSFANATFLHRIILSSNQLTEIRQNTFLGASELETLWVYNNSIKYVSPKAFETLTKLTWICLWRNQLEVIDAETFAPLSNLRFLDLDENRIKSVSPNAFVKNVVLNEMLLSNNPLEELKLEIASSLNVIHLFKNQMKKLALTAKNSTARIFQIDAESNNLTNFDIDPKLGVKKIDLAGNRIKSLEPFLELSSLIFLNLDSNSLTDLKNINRLSGLTNLVVSNNSNICLTPGIFSSLTNLKFLSLTANNMTEFKYDWFGRRLEHLQTLELGRNQLKELNYAGLDRRFPALKEVKINENLFNCSFLKQMLSYWKNYTEVKVLDAYSQNVDKILCLEKVEEESSIVWNLLIVMFIVIIGAALLYFGYKQDWKLPSQLDIRNSVRNLRIVRRDNGLVRLVNDESQ